MRDFSVFDHILIIGNVRTGVRIPLGLQRRWIRSAMEVYAQMLIARGRYDYDDRARISLGRVLIK
jgi:hypothetical protein